MPRKTPRFRAAATRRQARPYRIEDDGGHPAHARRLKHLHDDDLVLYSGGEIRTAPAQAHLHVCRGCRDRLRALELDVDRLSLSSGRGEAPTGPAPVAPLLPRKPAWWRRLLDRLVPAGDRRGG